MSPGTSALHFAFYLQFYRCHHLSPSPSSSTLTINLIRLTSFLPSCRCYSTITYPLALLRSCFFLLTKMFVTCHVRPPFSSSYQTNLCSQQPNNKKRTINFILQKIIRKQSFLSLSTISFPFLMSTDIFDM